MRALNSYLASSFSGRKKKKKKPITLGISHSNNKNYSNNNVALIYSALNSVPECVLGDLHSLSQWISINKSARSVTIVAFIFSTKRLGFRDGRAGIQTLADEFCLSWPMSYIDGFLPTSLGLSSGGNLSQNWSTRTPF